MTAELERILATAEEWLDRGLDFALATVVGVRGSTYRGLAARQLVGSDGQNVGTVSGGCLDQDLQREAAEVIRLDRPRLVEFDLTADDEAVWGWGIGCNGVTRLIVEPPSSVARLIEQVRRSPRPSVLVHRLEEDRLGERTVVVSGDSGPHAALAEQAVTEGWHRVIDTDGEHLMLEVIGARRRLIVCGAGHDAAPVVRFGAELGYEVWVVDDRRQFLSEQRFPEAAQLVQVRASELSRAVELSPSASVVVMSHNYLRDLDYLDEALGHRLAYIGVLGPGERLERLLKDLAERGRYPDDHDRAVLHGPAGLDIGAEGPVEIAWAIMGELLAVRRGKQAGFLRDRKGPASMREYDPSTSRASGDRV